GLVGNATPLQSIEIPANEREHAVLHGLPREAGPRDPLTQEDAGSLLELRCEGIPRQEQEQLTRGRRIVWQSYLRSIDAGPTTCSTASSTRETCSSPGRKRIS